jgi:hypothetical protein
MRDEISENILRSLEGKEIEELKNSNIELEKRIAAFEELSKNSGKQKKEEKFSHAVQILILDYLGIGKNINKSTLKAEIYAPLIRRDIETTRQLLSGINEYKNIKNLEIIVEYFTKAGYSDLIELIEKDIHRIKKKS